MTRTALWTAAEAAAATGGRAIGDWQARGVTIDSRAVANGDLFIALAGPNFDGHRFAADALAAGAAAVMVHGASEAFGENAPALLVPDTMDGLNALGAAARDRSTARVCAVTGSVGKTGTKEALRHVLGRQGRATASVSSFNNHWGVPLSLARMGRDADFGVFEVGMNHAGEITPLTRLIRPHVAVITTIAPVHTEFFDSVDAIADAKAEIFLGMDSGGTAVLNRDNPYFPRLEQAARAQGVGRIIGFGADKAADARVVDSTLEPAGSAVRADILGRVVDYRIAVPGAHWVLNSLAVLAAAGALGADVAEAAAALADMPALDGRGLSHRVTIKGGAFTLVDESYNANPASMRALIDTLARMRPGTGGRRIAALGDMRELGDGSAGHHAALAEPLAEHDIDLVFCAGGDMAHLWDALPAARRGAHAETGAELADALCRAVRPGDVVAVKGSNASRMKIVVERLLKCGTAPVEN